MTATEGYSNGSIITPEAVLLDFELAGVGSRALSFAVDLIVQMVALVAFLVVVGLVASGSELAGLIIMLVGLIVIMLGYPVIFEVTNSGRTLGRMVVGTRVVTVEGAPVRFRQSFIRSLLSVLDNFATAGGMAVVSALVTRRGQRVGDLVAGTMVIRDARPTGQTRALYFWAPGYLAAWSDTVDARSLGDDVYQLVRDFLSRFDLEEGARLEVAEELALLVSERLPHAARPSTVPPLDYLAAIAAATQDKSTAPSPPSPYAAASPTLPPPPGVAPTQPMYPARRVPAPPPPPSGYAATPASSPVVAAPYQPTSAATYEPPHPTAMPPGQSAPAAHPAPPAPPAHPVPAAPPMPPAPPPAPPAPVWPPPNEGGFATPG